MANYRGVVLGKTEAASFEGFSFEAASEESKTLAGLENAHHNQAFETSYFEGLA